MQHRQHRTATVHARSVASAVRLPVDRDDPGDRRGTRGRPTDVDRDGRRTASPTGSSPWRTVNGGGALQVGVEVEDTPSTCSRTWRTEIALASDGRARHRGWRRLAAGPAHHPPPPARWPAPPRTLSTDSMSASKVTGARSPAHDEDGPAGVECSTKMLAALATAQARTSSAWCRTPADQRCTPLTSLRTNASTLRRVGDQLTRTTSASRCSTTWRARKARKSSPVVNEVVELATDRRMTTRRSRMVHLGPLVATRSRRPGQARAPAAKGAR